MTTRDQSQTPTRRTWLRRRNIVFAVLGVVGLILGFGIWVLLETLKVHNAVPSPQVNYRLQHREYIENSLGIDSKQATRAWDLLIEALEQQYRIDDSLWEEMQDLKSSLPWDEAQAIEFDYGRIVSGDPRDPTRARDSAIPGVDYLLYEPRPALRIDSTSEDDG